MQARCFSCEKDFNSHDGGTNTQKGPLCPKCVGQCDGCTHLVVNSVGWCYMFLTKPKSCCSHTGWQPSSKQHKEI